MVCGKSHADDLNKHRSLERALQRIRTRGQRHTPAKGTRESSSASLMMSTKPAGRMKANGRLESSGRQKWEDQAAGDLDPRTRRRWKQTRLVEAAQQSIQEDLAYLYYGLSQEQVVGRSIGLSASALARWRNRCTPRGAGGM